MQVSFLLALLLLQLVHVLFLGLHDWIPLGGLNDVRAVRRENSLGELLLGTLMSTAPFVPPLLGSAEHLHTGLPGWITRWLVIGYGLLFMGELRAWWVPYFFGAKPGLAERYRAMFGATLRFLPERNGIVVNTLHVGLHTCTLALLVLIAFAIHAGAAHW